MPLQPRPVLAAVGAIVYAAAGGVIGAQNAGWSGSARDANALIPLLGLGAALAIFATRATPFHERLVLSVVGRVAGYLLVTGALLYVVSWVIQFAILGTLALALGLICLAVAVWTHRLGAVVDRVLVTISAMGSLTWNTETTSAFLLVGVGLIWAILVFRLLPAGSADPPGRMSERPA